MRVSEWMTKDVVTVTADVSMMKASRLMKEKRIRRLPVVDEEGRIIGIISDRDVKDASPSKATTLDMHELYYLLAELKIKDVMTKNPVCAKLTDSVESVALAMAGGRFGGMPIVDDQNKVCGIITDSDVFKVLAGITGASMGGIQLVFELPAAPGALRNVLDELRELNAGVISVLTSQDWEGSPTRRVYVRLRVLSADVEKKVIEAMEQKFPMLYWEPAIKK